MKKLLMNSQVNVRRKQRHEIQQAYEGMMVRGARTSSRNGVLGLLVTRLSTGQLFGVTAAHVIDPDGYITNPDGELVGVGHKLVAKSGTKNENEYLPCSEALGLIAIEPGLPVGAHSVPTAFHRSIGDPFKSIGQHVRRIRRDGSLSTARLSGIEMCCSLRSGVDGKIRRYQGMLEIIDGQGAEAFASFGDSGSVVYDDAGEILGIVIGGIGPKAFAAPLYGHLNPEEFKVASTEDLSEHNDRAHASTFLAAEKAFEEDWPVIAGFADLLLNEQE